MSIKDDAYKFHKLIWNSPNRKRIHDVINKLKSSTRGHGNKIYPSPMLGLLLYNQQVLKNFHGKSPVEELADWSEEELKILFGVHKQVRRFNEQCLAPLALQLPQAINAVNPYKEYSHSISTEGFEEILFAHKDAEEIISSFHSHPGFPIALTNLSKINERPLDYYRTIIQFNSEIVEAGPGGEPQWIAEFARTRELNHPDVIIFRHIGALLSLHSSLSNLNQLIYQGLFQEELIQINRSHTIDYFWTTRGAGPSMWLMHIPYGYMYIFEVTDLIIVNIDKSEETGGLGNTLCNIHTQILPGSETTPGILKMRMIDENLNAYSYLMR